MEKSQIEYRREVAEPIFNLLESGESFYVIGAPSAGKTRFIDHLTGDNFDARRKGNSLDRHLIKKRYLGENQASDFWLVRVDLNRLRIENGWDFGFFELLLNTLLLTSYKCEESDEAEKIKTTLASLWAEVINSKDSLIAHRQLEMAITKICQIYDIRICFLFDEFDEIYQTMPKEVFGYLRAIRDANKYFVSYALFLRNLPEKLRPPEEIESFYELISRNPLGLGPFTETDSLHVVIKQLEERHDLHLTQEKRLWLYNFSGGHPGFIQALLKLYKERPQSFEKMQNPAWCAKQEIVQEECRKLWFGLLDNEQQGLLHFVNGSQHLIQQDTGKLLLAKGMLKPMGNGEAKVFSPLFKHWLSEQEFNAYVKEGS